MLPIGSVGITPESYLNVGERDLNQKVELIQARCIEHGRAGSGWSGFEGWNKKNRNWLSIF